MHRYRETDAHKGTRAEERIAVPKFLHDIVNIVKLLLLAAIGLLFLRAMLYPNALDMFILMMLFVVLVAMFAGR
ncbi:hypothetical protein [Kyrpidia tusciae]|uniref:hypothetical protein n=1 Tax=Kyrpidia tusciae TaxID=33943 RepID=UPI0009FBFAF8|nr:hypothetical protein [Kyrpidia tusciae]MBE3551558.1 hypothetical protein [Kyrpidia tusciae]